MNLVKLWGSPLLAASMLFFAGVIFGAGLPLTFSTPSISLIFNGFTAFGTLLLGVAALIGINQWKNQFQSKVIGEYALRMLARIEPATKPLGLTLLQLDNSVRAFYKCPSIELEQKIKSLIDSGNQTISLVKKEIDRDLWLLYAIKDVELLNKANSVLSNSLRLDITDMIDVPSRLNSIYTEIHELVERLQEYALIKT